MNTKTLLAALAAGVFSFLLGWVVWDMLGLMDYFAKNTTAEYNALMKGPESMSLPGLFLSNLVMGLLLAWALGRMNASTWMGGLVAGAMFGALITLSYDLFFHSMMNMFTGTSIMVVDVLVAAVTTGLTGAVAGFVLGTGKKTA